MGIREDQKEQRRTDILVAALDLFIRKGYAATKITDIAKAVGMSTGLLFHYFDSKEALYEALIEVGVSGPQGVMQLNHEDPLAFFRDSTAMILESLTTHPLSAKLFVLMIQAYYSEPISDKVKEMLGNSAAIEESVPVIVRGQELGQIKAGNPFALSLTFWSAVQGVAQAFAWDMSLPLPEVDWFLDILRA
ncbi:MAG TPA: TetR/AcrR family transcriptional regulator [Lachnospiraceae bacterium]|nr:TetR/AcrR family transcriptional regulator [Lachnospiraceae bacterium]